MSKLGSLAIPLVVLVAVGSVFATLEAGRVPDWRIELAKYVASRRPPTTVVRVRAVAPARRPWNYRLEMGRPVVDDTVWGSTQLPFPPQRVMCALLESESIARSPTREPAVQVVYICHHSDALWQAGWVIHEHRGDPFSGATHEQLSSLACDLQLTQFKPEHAPLPRAPLLRGADRARDLLPLVLYTPGTS